MMAIVGRLAQHSIIGWPVSVRDDAAKMSRVNCEWHEEKSCERSFKKVWCVCVCEVR